MSINTNLNDDGWRENRHDRYGPTEVSQDVSGVPDKQTGCYSKPPKLSHFNGEEVPQKYEISFNRWLFEVRNIQQSYAVPFVRETII